VLFLRSVGFTLLINTPSIIIFLDRTVRPRTGTHVTVETTLEPHGLGSFFASSLPLPAARSFLSPRCVLPPPVTVLLFHAPVWKTVPPARVLVSLSRVGDLSHALSAMLPLSRHQVSAARYRTFLVACFVSYGTSFEIVLLSSAAAGFSVPFLFPGSSISRPSSNPCCSPFWYCPLHSPRVTR